VSKTQPYRLSYFPGPNRPAVNGPVRRIEHIDYTEHEYFDTEEKALVRLEELRTSKQGHNFRLFKDEKLLKGGGDLENYACRYVFRQRRQRADD
jgi:hypothetical protein